MHYLCDAQNGRRVVLIWYRYSVHRAATALFAAYHPDWFTKQFTQTPQSAPAETARPLLIYPMVFYLHERREVTRLTS